MDNRENTDLGLIDIMQIMGQWMVSLVKTLADWFLRLFFFAVKRWLPLLIVACVAIGYSVISFKTQEHQYQANMIIRSNAVQSTQMKSFMQGYSTLLKNDMIDDSDLQSRTGLTAEQRSLVSSMSTFYCVDEDRDGFSDRVDFANRYDAATEGVDSLNLCVNVVFQDLAVLQNLQESIVFYMENNTYIKNRNANRLSELTKRKRFLASEISFLDSLQSSVYEGVNTSNATQAKGGYFLVDNRNVLVYEDKLILLEQLETVERDIEIHSGAITIVEDFVISQRVINSLSSILKNNVITALLVAYLAMFLVFLYNREKVKYLK